MENLDFLRTELDIQIDRFGKESTKHKEMYRNFKYLIFGLSGISTVLAGIAAGLNNQYYLNIGIIITTALISVVNSIDGLRKPSELWIMERNLFYALKDLRRELEFDLSKTNGSISIDEYFDRMQGLLNSASEKWSGKVGKKEK